MRRLDIEYLVEPQQDHWTIGFSGRHCGHYPSETAAVLATLAAALRVRERGNVVRIGLRRPDGSVRALSS